MQATHRARGAWLPLARVLLSVAIPGGGVHRLRKTGHALDPVTDVLAVTASACCRYPIRFSGLVFRDLLVTCKKT